MQAALRAARLGLPILRCMSTAATAKRQKMGALTIGESSAAAVARRATAATAGAAPLATSVC
jgi:hypothetical protein